MQLESDGDDDDTPASTRDAARDNTQVQDMEEESSEDSEDEDGCARMGSSIGQRPFPPGTTPRINPAPPTQPQQPQPPPLPPAPDKVLVKKGYDPKQGNYSF